MHYTHYGYLGLPVVPNRGIQPLFGNLCYIQVGKSTVEQATVCIFSGTMNVDMAVTHTNRKGDTYHLTRRKGSRTQYVFSKKDLYGEAVDSIPNGYEVFEHPNGQVFLRRQIISEVPDADYRVIEQYMREHFRDELYILERKRREVVIHFADEEPEHLLNMVTAFNAQARPDKLEKLRRELLRYSPMMRISYDSRAGEYTLERYCFLGGIDDWMHLENSTSVKKLVAKYCKHLGEESFFDLI